MRGGSVEEHLSTFNEATVTVLGGMIEGHLCAYDDSFVGIRGGSVKEYVWSLDSAAIAMSGGFSELLRAESTFAVTMSGGSTGSVILSDTSSVINGGSIENLLWALDSSVVKVVEGSWGKKVEAQLLPH